MPNAEPYASWAQHAAHSVILRHGSTLLGLPGTHLGRVRSPSTPLWPLGPWHYWWQAHYVDALLDAALRGGPSKQHFLDLAGKLVRTMWLRNGFRFVNRYFDDMAWLALAAQRLAAIPGSRPLPRTLISTLSRQFDSAITPELGGGAYWHHRRDFKNAAATGPIALFLARSAQSSQAQALVDWMLEYLPDPQTGLIRDGVRQGPAAAPTVDTAVFSYNQGPLLGSLLALGGPVNLAAAADLIRAVDAGLRLEHGNRPLRSHGGGDGGLFTGILCRYLALAASDARLDPAVRQIAVELVQSTASSLWDGRAVPESGSPRGAVPDSATASTNATASGLIFPRDTGSTAALDYPQGRGVELSTQLQAWMCFEAAAISAVPPAPGEDS